VVFGFHWVLPLACSGQEMRLYLVWDSEGICERTDSIVEDLFEAVDGDTDSEAAPRRRKDKKRKKKSSSDSSEDDEDKDEESGSDSESEKVGLDYWVCFPAGILLGLFSRLLALTENVKHAQKNMSKRFPTMYVFFTEEQTRATDDLDFIDGIEASCWCPNPSTLFIRERRRRRRVRKAVERKVAGRRRKERRRKPRRSERNAWKRRSKRFRRKRSVRRRSSRRNYLEKAKRPFR